jgi:exonuclease VII large subunit
LDEVAKISAKTPSDAARLLIDIVDEYFIKITDFKNNIDKLIENKSKLYLYEIDKIYDLINQQINFKVDKFNNLIDLRYNYIKQVDIDRLLKK